MRGVAAAGAVPADCEHRMLRDELVRHLQPWGARKRFAEAHGISRVTLWKYLTGRAPIPKWLAETIVC